MGFSGGNILVVWSYITAGRAGEEKGQKLEEKTKIESHRVGKVKWKANKIGEVDLSLIIFRAKQAENEISLRSKVHLFLKYHFPSSLQIEK